MFRASTICASLSLLAACPAVTAADEVYGPHGECRGGDRDTRAIEKASGPTWPLLGGHRSEFGTDMEGGYGSPVLLIDPGGVLRLLVTRTFEADTSGVWLVRRGPSVASSRDRGVTWEDNGTLYYERGHEADRVGATLDWSGHLAMFWTSFEAWRDGLDWIWAMSGSWDPSTGEFDVTPVFQADGLTGVAGAPGVAVADGQLVAVCPSGP